MVSLGKGLIAGHLLFPFGPGRIASNLTDKPLLVPDIERVGSAHVVSLLVLPVRRSGVTRP